MERIWEKASQSEYEKCFNILNTESLIEKETYVKFATELFEIAKKQLNITNCNLKFIDNMGNSLGVSSIVNRSVTLNLSKMEKQTLFKTVSTIYHELTHIHQDTTKYKKKIETVLPAKFPFINCSGNENFLPTNMLGISPFLFYYTCQVEKQARDVGSECAMDLFLELKKIAETKSVRNGTKLLIDRCINQVQLRWNTENKNNELATMQINEFLKLNPNFRQNAFNKIKQEFLNDANKYGITTKERMQYENRFICRIGILVLMGCDDNLKNQILSFVSSNFISKGEIFNALITVIDSPYSKTTKNDLISLFKFAEQNNFPKDIMLNYLTNWDRNYIYEVIQNKDNFKPFNIPNLKK